MTEKPIFLIEHRKLQPAPEVSDEDRERAVNWANNIAKRLTTFPFERWHTHILSCDTNGTDLFVVWSEDSGPCMLAYREMFGWVAYTTIGDIRIELPITTTSDDGFLLSRTALVFLRITPDRDIARLMDTAPRAIERCIWGIRTTFVS